MVLALLVVLLGCGLGALGLLDPDLYVIGLLVVVIGGVGVLVRLVDWLRRLRGAPPSSLHDVNGGAGARGGAGR